AAPAGGASLDEPSGGQQAQLAQGGVQAGAGLCGDGGRPGAGFLGDRVQDASGLLVQPVAGHHGAAGGGQLLADGAELLGDLGGAADADRMPVPEQPVAAGG